MSTERLGYNVAERLQEVVEESCQRAQSGLATMLPAGNVIELEEFGTFLFQMDECDRSVIVESSLSPRAEVEKPIIVALSAGGVGVTASLSLPSKQCAALRSTAQRAGIVDRINLIAVKLELASSADLCLEQRPRHMSENLHVSSLYKSYNKPVCRFPPCPISR
ncbi:hypothetical protein J6590_072338 [Homalodisca vitripennis]|nr:hypothetical protein J6590_072338 [Homalodisca vitripennis]